MGRKLPDTAGSVAGALVGGRLATLEAVRATLARQIDGAACCRECGSELKEPPAAKAQLSRELRAVLSEIADLSPSEVAVPSGLDEITRRREDRIAAAHVAGSAVRRVRQRGR